jgi:aminoglycoside phosphotransferase (APT) family kinase protein
VLVTEHDLDFAGLQRYVETNGLHLGKFQSASKFPGGQSNPTYKLVSDAGVYVLRRKPNGVLLPSAHAIEREFQVLRALHGSDVPLAKPVHLCTDPNIIGTPFYIMEYLAGRVFWNPALPECSTGERASIYQEIATVLGRLHRINPADIGLRDFAKPGNYFARQLNRWSEQYRLSQTDELPQMTELMQQLDQLRRDENTGNAIESSARQLCHGDFRIDNLMFHASEPKIIGIMDWELSTLGDGLADASYFCMALRLPKNPNLPGLAGLDRHALGIPSEADWRRTYEQASGQAIPDAVWPFSLAFNFFRLAAIAQGVKKRAQAGNASNAKANEVGAMVGLLAKLGLEALASRSH